MSLWEDDHNLEFQDIISLEEGWRNKDEDEEYSTESYAGIHVRKILGLN